MEVNLENRKKSNECQKMMEVENEEVESVHVSKEINVGGAVESDIVMERALKDVKDMRLAVVEDAIEVSNVGGIKNGSRVDCRSVGICIPKVVIGLEDGNNGSQENEKNRDEMLESNLDLEEELNQMIIHRKKKKGLNKKIRSMNEIQSSLLTSKERKKRDRAKLKEKGREHRKKDEKIINLSLSNSDISNIMRVILREANNTWALRKKLGFSVHGDEEDLGGCYDAVLVAGIFRGAFAYEIGCLLSDLIKVVLGTVRDIGRLFLVVAEVRSEITCQGLLGAAVVSFLAGFPLFFFV
ncbi:hypothetical protein PVK06_018167 [Gossypium arboreum]|uniref:Uncharacterized protein n=1 Tax=Gossypium arboreum TaxID=29729 RepID=A0ABR0Q550_GOSAR|nr:hypothetical protein PVK06_018167 [Gossypium arboreum]